MQKPTHPADPPRLTPLTGWPRQAETEAPAEPETLPPVAMPVAMLLRRWQEAYRQGQDIPLDELCRDCPEHVEEVRRHIHTLRSGPGVRADATSAGGAEQLPPSGWPRVPGYEVLGELGRGGMGVVYQARQTRLNRLVALKMILAGPGAGPEHRQRFQAEAEAVARLQHPNVVQIFEVGEHDGLPFFSLEFVAGGTLAGKFRDGPPPPRTAARLILTLARAVHAAHQQGIIHRDLKPQNVLLTADGTPKITDFGLARRLDGGAGLSRSGDVMGTPGYMAPEQALGDLHDIGPATDVYALGAILYELLTGQPPFGGDTPLKVLFRVTTEPPRPPSQLRPDVPPELEAVCLRCLQKKPAARYPTAAVLADALGRIVDDATLPYASAPVPPPPPRPRRSRWPWTAGAAGLLALAGVAAALVLFSALSGPDDPAGLPALKGSIDVLISEPDNPERQNLRLHQEEALPLRPGDEFCVVAKLNRPAYLYVLWIDTDGDVHPLYPWKPDDWHSRPDRERAVRALRRPEALDEFFQVARGTPGMETLVLLARETPLPAAVDLRAELGKFPPQTAQAVRATVWFENGNPVLDETDRRARFDLTRRRDPVLRTQERLRTLLGRHFRYTRAVSFANRGR